MYLYSVWFVGADWILWFFFKIFWRVFKLVYVILCFCLCGCVGILVFLDKDCIFMQCDLWVVNNFYGFWMFRFSSEEVSGQNQVKASVQRKIRQSITDEVDYVFFYVCVLIRLYTLNCLSSPKLDIHFHVLFSDVRNFEKDL